MKRWITTVSSIFVSMMLFVSVLITYINSPPTLIKTLDQLNASIVIWKWNLGHKIAIKHTLPNGKTVYWPESPTSCSLQ